ncbi:MAG: glycoside hydrolase family 31 protein [Phycisphaerales bacterium]
MRRAWSIACVWSALVGAAVVTAPAMAQTVIATDNADDAAYDVGWTDNSNGGAGFGGWSFVAEASGGFAGRFIADEGDSGPSNVLNQVPGRAWALFANAGAGAERSAAFRVLNTAIGEAGSSLEVTFEHGYIASGGRVGVALRTGNAHASFGDVAAGARTQVYFEGGHGAYTVADAGGETDTGVAFGLDGLVARFIFTGGGGYTLEIQQFTNESGASTTTTITGLTLAGSGSIDSVALFNDDGGASGSLNHDAYFNNLIVSADTSAVRSYVGDGIVRYDASAATRAVAAPSFALEAPLPIGADAPAGLDGEPTFSTEGGKRVVRFDVPAGTSLYGTGLVPGPLERTGRTTTLWNSDSWNWVDSTESLYESHPWVLAVKADGSAFGVLFDTTWRTEIDLTGASGSDVRVASDGPSFPVYVVHGASPAEVVRELSSISGRAPMPPLWALGFQQSRGTYSPQSVALGVATELREHAIPADVVWLDVGYMNDFRQFTFDSAAFPDPIGLNDDLDAMGFRTVASHGPFFRQDTSWSVYNEIIANNLAVLSANGSGAYSNIMWWNQCVWGDFLMQDARDWFAGHVASFLSSTGIDGVWIDVSEPAVWNSYATLPPDTIIRADAALGGTDTQDRYHNVYGMELNRAAREGQLLADPGRRPFVLGRSSALGGQRYATVWSGDIGGTWYHVDQSIQNVLNLGLSGQPWSGPDIGGYENDIDATMYARWMGIGTMLPFCRSHTSGSTMNKEPWAFGAVTERVARLAVQRRYRLLPHLYTLAYEAHTEGTPIVRPLFFADPSDAGLRTRDDAFLLGDGLVVAALTTETGTIQRPALPEQLYRFGFPESNDPTSASDVCEGDLPQLFVRSGHIVPVQGVIQSTRDGYAEDMGLVLALDSGGVATGRLYEDAGDGYAFEQGEYLLTDFIAEREGSEVFLEVADQSGAYMIDPGATLDVRVLLGDADEYAVTVPDPRVDGVGARVSLGDVPMPTGSVLSCSVTAPADAVDGRSLNGAFAGAPIDVVQAQATSMGDNVDELDRLWMEVTPDGLRLGIAGNIDDAGAAIVVLLDTGEGGSEVLGTSSISGASSLLRGLNGTRMDAGFAPDRMLFVRATGGWVDAQWVSGLGTSPVLTDLGLGAVGSGSGVLVGGAAPVGTRVAVDNSNTAGVTDASAANADTATTGLEAFIPNELLTPSGSVLTHDVGVMAYLVWASKWVGNQMLPPATSSVGVLGTAPDFTGVAGDQFVVLTVASCLADIDGNGTLNLDDVNLFATGFIAGDTGVDQDGNGVLNLDDVNLFAQGFIAGCP